MVKRRFSNLELQHLFISVFVMSVAVALWARSLYMFPVALLCVGPGFVFHEIGHKFVAQKYGYFAEYRMWAKGLMLALITSALGFLIIAPGAVYFSMKGLHYGAKDKIGKIGLAGPIINILLAVGFSMLYFFGGSFNMIGYFGAYVNSWLAIFNLIPVSPLDGHKVFAWNKKIWVLTLAMAVIVFGITLTSIKP